MKSTWLLGAALGLLLAVPASTSNHSDVLAPAAQAIDVDLELGPGGALKRVVSVKPQTYKPGEGESLDRANTATVTVHNRTGLRLGINMGLRNAPRLPFYFNLGPNQKGTIRNVPKNKWYRVVAVYAGTTRQYGHLDFFLRGNFTINITS